MTVAVLAPIIIILGVAPGLEATLYSTVVVVILLGAAWLLLALVYAQREPASA
jgi:membrane-bound ClpP family serine protease